MPNRNNMGPLGDGPMTGRGLGKCKGAANTDDTAQSGRGAGMGRRGNGRGMGRGMNQQRGFSIRQRLESLEKAIFNKD